MIYEAGKGETVGDAARGAIVSGCDKFIHNDRVYAVRIEWSTVATYAPDPKPKPAEPLEFGGQSKP